jgi:hypothetical protein
MHVRIHAIDALRGFCLLNIFVNHVSAGFANQLSPSRILFFDSADAFVLLAGISSFLAYGPRTDGGSIEVARILRRCWTIYLCDLLIIACSAIILIAAELNGRTIHPVGVIALFDQHGPAYLWHLVTLQQSIAYSVVLRLYVFLFLMAPVYLWLAAQRYWYPVAFAAAIWLAAGLFQWAEHDSLTGQPLMLTVLPWNLPFALGVAIGAAMRAGVTLPRSPIANWAAAALVLAGPVCFVFAARLSPDVLSWVEARDDSFWLGASKRFQSPLRVASLIAFIWLFIALARAPVVRLIHAVSPANIFCVLGRHSLQVYAAGAIGAVAFQQAFQPIVRSSPAGVAAADLAAIALGFGAMILIATSRDTLSGRRKAYNSPLFHTTRPTMSRSASGTSTGG